MWQALRLFDAVVIAVLGFIVATLFAIVGFEGRLTDELVALQVRSPIIMSREIWLPSANGSVVVVPVAWTQASIDHLTQGLGRLGTVSRLTVNDGYLRTHDKDYQRLRIIDVGPEVFTYLSINKQCSSADIYFVRSAKNIRDPELGLLDNNAVAITSIPDSLALRAIASGEQGDIALRCRPSEGGYPKAIFLPTNGQSLAALKALRARAKTDTSAQTDFAPAKQFIEPLSEVVARQIVSDYSWLGSFRIGFICLVFATTIGFALFDASRARDSYRIMRALGSSIDNLVYLSLKRVAIRVLFATLFGLILLLLVVVFSNAGLSISDLHNVARGAAVIGITIFVASIAHSLYATIAIDQFNMQASNVSGNGMKSFAVATCLLMMAFSISLFALFATCIGQYAVALANMPLGYNPNGLYALEAIPVTPDALAGKNIQATLAAPLDMVVRTPDLATIICGPPWSLDSFIVDRTHANVGINILSGASIASILDIAIKGRDLQKTDMRDGKAMLLQAEDASFKKSAYQFGFAVGSTSNILVGALAPRRRNLTFTALGNAECNSPIVLYRPQNTASDNHAAASKVFFASLQSSVDTYAIQAPVEVKDIIAQLRLPLESLRTSANYGLLSALLCLVLVSSLSSAAYVDSRRRIIAIKHALGQVPMAAALEISLKTFIYAGMGAVLAAGAWPILELAVRSKFVDIPAMPFFDMAAVIFLVIMVMGFLAFCFGYRHVARIDLVTSLRVE